MQSFENKVAVITGGASGMGRYLAVLLAKMGCNVAICDINEDELSKTSSMLSQYNVASSQHVVDIGDKKQIDQFYEDVMARHQKVDLVFRIYQSKTKQQKLVPYLVRVLHVMM